MSDDTLVGKSLGPYEILGLLGRGPHSAVYRAFHAATNRTVAIKVLHPEFLQEKDFQERFERDVRKLADLDHPHILRVYDVGQANERPFIVMDYLTGGTLANLLARYGRLSLAETVPIIQQVASALDYAHAQGMVHRYLKPSNIMLDQHGTAFVTDFGISTVREAVVSANQSGILSGAAYVSPEVISGQKRISPAADTYSLGVIVFEMLTGQHPFKGENAAATAKLHLTSEPPSPSAINPEIPAVAEAVILKALAKNPKDRYSSTGAMADALSSAAGVSTSAVKQRTSTDVPGTGEFRRPSMPLAPPKSMGPLTPPPGTLKQIDLEPETPPPGSFKQSDFVDVEGVDFTPPPKHTTPAPEQMTPPPGQLTPVPGATPILGGSMGPPTPPPSHPSLSWRDLPPKERRRLEKERRKQRKALEKKLGVGTRWYTFVLATFLVVLAWFIIGVMIGTQARRSVQAQAVAVAEGEQTATAQVEAAEATATAEALITAGVSPSATEIIVIPATEEATPTPTLTEAPEDTPTPTSEPTSTPSPTATQIGGSAGLIAYISDRDGDEDLYLLNLSTRETRQLTFNTALEGWPVWSPDGIQIAYFSSETPQGQHIYVIDPENSTKTEITEGIRVDSYPIWSADGTQVAFHSFESTRSYVRAVELETLEEETIAQIPAAENRLFDWSADGNVITYFGFSSASTLEVLELDVPTGVRTPLTRANGRVQFMNYSPDRTLNLFTNLDARGISQIFISDNDALCTLITDCNTRQITEGDANWTRPRFSPDGTLILATSDQNDNLDLFLLTLEGNIVEQLTDTPADESQAVWQPQ